MTLRRYDLAYDQTFGNDRILVEKNLFDVCYLIDGSIPGMGFGNARDRATEVISDCVVDMVTSQQVVGAAAPQRVESFLSDASAFLYCSEAHFDDHGVRARLVTPRGEGMLRSNLLGCFNLSNLLCGWNPNRVFNLTAFVGGGANIAFSNGEANSIANTLKSLDAYNLDYVWDGTKVRLFGRGGLEAAFRLSEAVALTLE